MDAATPTRAEQPAIGEELPPANPWIVLLLFGGYVAFFFSFSLPNNPNWSRIDLAEELVFNYLFDSNEAHDSKIPSGVQYLAQRCYPAIVAAFILASSLATGRLLIRVLRFHALESRLLSFVFSAGLGISACSLTTLLLGWFAFLDRTIFVTALTIPVVAEVAMRLFSKSESVDQSAPTRSQMTRLKWFVILAVAPFLCLMFLGAMLPSVDFDVKEYHLQGPKEFYLAGQITMLPHNVYTSMPFLTEMLSLSGMVLCDDWYLGALAGKTVLASFAVLTSMCVFAIAREYFSSTAAWIAALVHLTTPWTYRISIIAYVEGGLSFFVAASVLAVIRATRCIEQDRQRWVFLAGVMTGSAMSCKYPGLISAVIPCWVWLVVARWKSTRCAKQLCSTTIVFGFGVIAAVGPWLIKNTIETGNPVYPLAYEMFGGIDWDDQLNEKWKTGHSPDNYALSDLGEKAIDVLAKSDWLSPLLFGLALITLCSVRRNPALLSLWLFVGYLFASWWVLTHRLDRFWIPLIPIVAVLAGAGVEMCMSRRWLRNMLIATTGVLVLFNLGFISTGLCGYNQYLIDLEYARNARGRASSVIAVLNRTLPDNSKVLFVGHADVFDAEFDHQYNTVFDYSLIEQYCRGDATPLRTADEIREKFTSNGITHVCVNWRQIIRYRTTYGYTAFVAPKLFDELQRSGVLDKRTDLGAIASDDIGTQRERAAFREWSDSLRDGDSFATASVYRVLSKSSQNHGD